MELRHLRYFLAVAEELHFGRAAERLHISQPPLSTQIKDLEDDIGVMLLKRTRREVSLTPPGKLFLRKVRMILSEIDNAVEGVQALDRGEADKISIGYKSAFMLQAIAPLLQQFQAHYPDVEFQFTQASTQAQYDAIKDHRLDLGFVDAPPIDAGENQQSDDLIGTPAKRLRMGMAVPADHSLAKNKLVHLSQFARDDFIFIDRQTVPSIYDLHIGLCQQAGFSPRIKFTTSQLPETLTYVAAGKGVCFAPESLIGSWPGLISFIKLKEEAYVTITALSRADHDGKALKAFREILVDSSS